MKSLVADFVQFSGACAKFLFLEGRLGTGVSARNFEIFLNFLISKDCKSYVIQQFVR